MIFILQEDIIYGIIMSAKKQEIRENFRNDVFKRDGYICKFCNKTEDLDAHHITPRKEMPNGGYVKSNGITVCPLHHKFVESPDCTLSILSLYSLIGSSYEQAYEDSLNLNK